MNNIYMRHESHISIALRCLYIVIILLFNQACSEETSQKSNAAVSVSKQAASTQTELGSALENKITNQAKQIVVKYKLSELPLTCLEFDTLEKIFEGKRIIDVREKHGDSCEGDPDISPRLFSIGIEQSTGAIWSDARSMLGQLESLGME